MINASDLSGKLALDANGLNDQKQAAKQNTPDAVRKVATQFEAMFVNMMLKSMRDATPQDGIFDSEQSRTFTSMLDQQLSQNLASKGLGLADVLVKQLSKSNVSPEQAKTSAFNINDPISSFSIDRVTESLGAASEKASSALDQAGKVIGNGISKLAGAAGDFLQRMASHAAEASLTSGIPANFMLGQAALESGWGRHEIRAIDGSSSHNLFGIKAGPSWDGKVVEAVTTEYINGIKQKRIEKFRAYDSYADSFRDFANMISNNPRYENAMNKTDNLNEYAQALQKAGYATDPNYASKLVSIVKKVTVT